MIRLSAGDKLVIASHNEGKVREIRELLAPFGLNVIGAAKLRLPEPEETGSTFAENAKLKAEAASSASGLPALADDSGNSQAVISLTAMASSTLPATLSSWNSFQRKSGGRSASR